MLKIAIFLSVIAFATAQYEVLKARQVNATGEIDRYLCRTKLRSNGSIQEANRIDILLKIGASTFMGNVYVTLPRIIIEKDAPLYNLLRSCRDQFSEDAEEARTSAESSMKSCTSSISNRALAIREKIEKAMDKAVIEFERLRERIYDCGIYSHNVCVRLTLDRAKEIYDTRVLKPLATFNEDLHNLNISVPNAYTTTGTGCLKTHNIDTFESSLQPMYTKAVRCGGWPD